MIMGRLLPLRSCSLVYCIDSKGYYQPDYQFECVINGEESEIMIPARSFCDTKHIYTFQNISLDKSISQISSYKNKRHKYKYDS